MMKQEDTIFQAQLVRTVVVDVFV